MNTLKNIMNNKIIIIIIIIIIAILVILIYFTNDNENNLEILEQAEVQKNEENIQNENKQEEIKEEQKETIAIHITGEVKNPGIIYLKKGARIADAIKLAGGATKNAGLDKVNLAYILEDGQKIYIPNKKEKIKQNEYIISNSGENVLVEEGGNNKTNTAEPISSKGEKNKVNINSANQTELETLPGIGPSLAQKIIEYREQNGKFQKIEDIKNVKGIGNSKYINIKELIII